MNAALLGWLMAAPDGPDETLILEDFLQRPAWHQHAACRNQGVTAFFSGTSANIDRARAICRDCSVRTTCFQYALSDDSLEGVWAGTTAKERRLMRRGR